MKIHFIGIGGIGVSSLAQYYLTKGYEVSGSDLALSEVTEFLAKKGVKFELSPAFNQLGSAPAPLAPATGHLFQSASLLTPR